MLAQLSPRSARFRTVAGPTAGLLSLIFTLSGCHKMPLTAPSGTSINLVAATNVLAVNGSTDVTAVLIESGVITSSTPGGGTTTPTTTAGGTPVQNGTVVTFTTSLGRIEPAEAQTTGGKTTVKLIADGRSGTATITAFSGAATKTLDVKVGAAAAARILVTATPQALPPTGGTATIAATVEDTQGNGLVGVPVAFSTSAGTLAATSVLTDLSGTASTTLTSSVAATVTASAGAASLTGTVALTVKSRNQVTLKGPTAAVNESAPVSFTIGVTTGSIVSDVLLDLGDGTKVHLGAVTADTTYQYIYADDGPFTVVATATDADGATTQASTGVIVIPVTITGTATPATTTLGTAVTFAVTVGGTGVAVDHFVFDFGDGTVIPTTSNSLAHVFTSTGTKTVNVTMVPSKGHSKTVTIVCQINP